MKYFTMWFMTLIMAAALMTGCKSDDDDAVVASDTIAPTVVSMVPADLDINVAINRSIIVTFSEDMDPATLTSTTFTLMKGVTPVAGVVTCVGKIATFNPNDDLVTDTVYIALITTGVKDLAGNPLAELKTWTFKSGLTSDTTLPTVLSTEPADIATAVAFNSNITATFDEPMDPLTLTTTTFTITDGTTPVAGAVTCLGIGTVATFNPTSDLVAGTTYTATITTGAKDLAGNALAVNKTWSFTTGAAPALGPAPVLLGTAGNYVILAKSAISNIPTSAITGNLGLSPAAASFITGFVQTMGGGNTYSTDPQVTGYIYGIYTEPTPTNLTTAVGDMETAYTDAAGRITPDFLGLGAGNVTGMTLAPGLYKWGTGLNIDGAGVTLNGGPNDVWIFQVAQNLTVANAAIITLSGGAKAKNIFWQVGGFATLGTTSAFKGIILCQTAITMNTGASVNGRLLAQTAVTLDSNAVTQPTP